MSYTEQTEAITVAFIILNALCVGAFASLVFFLGVYSESKKDHY